MINLNAIKDLSREDIYCHYQGQASPQPAYIEISHDGEVTAKYNGEIGGTRIDIWSNRVVTLNIHATSDLNDLYRTLANSTDLIERIIAGHDSGDAFTHGSYDNDALDARDTLQARLDNIDRVSVYDDIRDIYDHDGIDLTIKMLSEKHDGDRAAIIAELCDLDSSLEFVGDIEAHAIEAYDRYLKSLDID